MSVVKELLGHASIGTTIDTYGHPDLAAKADALALLGKSQANRG